MVCGVSGGGTWTSIAIRDSGCAIMKMMSSTSSTSIIGVTLISDETSPGPPPAAMAMGYSFPVFRSGAGTGSVMAAMHPHAGAPGHLDRVLHLAVLQVHVGLEVQDLVLGARRVHRPEIILQDRRVDRLGVEEVLPVLVDAEDDVRVLFGAGIEVLALGQGGLEARRDERRDDHEDDEEHQHHVDHRRDVDVRIHLPLATTRGDGHCRSPLSGPGIPW